jgi:NTP pyrophosphatase (non-canonical NTP hydrolase)
MDVKFKDIQKQIYKTNCDNGWWEEHRSVPELLCLVHSEVSEALEAYRETQTPGTLIKSIPGFAEELGDIIIRVMDMAEHFKIDLAKEILWKDVKNQKRGYKHGNKRC